MLDLTIDPAAPAVTRRRTNHGGVVARDSPRRSSGIVLDLTDTPNSMARIRQMRKRAAGTGTQSVNGSPMPHPLEIIDVDQGENSPGPSSTGRSAAKSNRMNPPPPLPEESDSSSSEFGPMLPEHLLGADEQLSGLHFRVGDAESRVQFNYKRAGRVIRRDGEFQRWKCKWKNCNVNGYQRLTTDIVRCTGEHTHELSVDALPLRKAVPPDVVEMISKLLRANKKVAEVAEELLAEHGLKVSQRNIEAVNQRLRREDGSLSSFLGSHPFVFRHSRKEGGQEGIFIVLVNRDLIATLAVETIHDLFLDGTRSVASHGTQLVTVSARIPSVQLSVPICHGMIQSHGKMLDYAVVCRAVRDLGIQPLRVHCDFELAEQNAIRETWPGAEIAGCAFHLQQALHRRLRLLYGGAAVHPQWVHIRNFGRRIFDSTTMNELVAVVTEMDQFCTQNNMRRFFEYFLKEWVNGRDIATFTQIRNADAHARRIRTNNAAEAINHHIKAVSMHHARFLNEKRVIEGLFTFSKAVIARLRHATANPDQVTSQDAVESMHYLQRLAEQESDRLLNPDAMLDHPPVLDVDPHGLPQHIQTFLRTYNMRIVENIGGGRCQQWSIAQHETDERGPSQAEVKPMDIVRQQLFQLEREDFRPLLAEVYHTRGP